LEVGGCRQAFKTLLELETAVEPLVLLVQYPILALEELPRTLEEMSRQIPDPRAQVFSKSRAGLLVKIQEAIRDNYPAAQAKLLKQCGLLLVGEQKGKPAVNLGRARRLFQEARRFCPADSEDYADCLLDEGTVNTQLSHLGGDARGLREEAIRLYQQARTIYAPTAGGYAMSLRNEGHTRTDLARQEVDARANLEEAIRLHQQVLTFVSPDDIEFAHNLLDEGVVRGVLALMDVDGEQNAREAIRLYQQARELYPESAKELGRSLADEARARLYLATKCGVEPRENYVAVLALCIEAYPYFVDFEGGAITRADVEFVTCLTSAAEAHRALAQDGVEAASNLSQAIQEFALASQVATALAFPDIDVPYLLFSEAGARRELADSGVEAEANLRAAIDLCVRAKELLPAEGERYAGCLMEEAACRAQLASL
jgi:tetratricopeptide (TPR) repeat protein